MSACSRPTQPLAVEVLAVYIARSDGLTAASPKEFAVQRTLVEDLGGTFHHVVGEDVSPALLDFAHGVNATQIVLGTSRRRTWQYLFGPGVGATVARDSGPDLDVHIVTHEEAARGRDLPVARGAPLGRTRMLWGWLTGVIGPALLTVLLTHISTDLGLANEMLLYLALTVGSALLGGLLPFAGLGRTGLAPHQLVLHPAGPRTHHRRPEEHRHHNDLLPGRGIGGLGGRPGGPPHLWVSKSRSPVVSCGFRASM